VKKRDGFHVRPIRAPQVSRPSHLAHAVQAGYTLADRENPDGYLSNSSDKSHSHLTNREHAHNTLA
jgi:hypothetical protein